MCTLLSVSMKAHTVLSCPLHQDISSLNAAYQHIQHCLHYLSDSDSAVILIIRLTLYHMYTQFQLLDLIMWSMYYLPPLQEVGVKYNKIFWKGIDIIE